MRIGRAVLIPAILAVGAAWSIRLLIRKVRKRRLAATPPKDGEPGQADRKQKLVPSKALLFLLVAVDIAWLYFDSPRAGVAIVAGISVLPMLSNMRLG
jgi:hypothetical protein